MSKSKRVFVGLRLSRNLYEKLKLEQERDNVSFTSVVEKNLLLNCGELVNSELYIEIEGSKKIRRGYGEKNE